VVRFIGKTRIGIQTINDAVKYSILAGLDLPSLKTFLFSRCLGPRWTRGAPAGAHFPVTFHGVAHGFPNLWILYGIAKFAHPLWKHYGWENGPLVFA
jgi:hypothetical protein